LKFRDKYGILYSEYVNLPFTKMSTDVIRMQGEMTQLFWAQWNCMGRDGVFSFDKNADKQMSFMAAVDPDPKRKRKYKDKCDRCQDPLPKGVKIYAQMAFGKLKNV